MAFYVGREDYTNRKRLESCVDALMIGTVALDQDGRPKIDQLDSMFHNYFIVKPLCDEPIPLNEVYSDDEENDYIGVDNQQDYDMLPMDYDAKNLANTKRLSMLDDHFYDKLLLFRPSLNTNRTSPDFMHKNLFVLQIIDAEEAENLEFYTVPRITMDTTSFKEKLKDGTYITFKDYNSDLRKSPDFVICGDNVFYTPNCWQKHDTQNTMWRCRDFNKVKQYALKIDANYSYEKLVKGSENLVFLNKSYAVDLQQSSDVFNVRPVLEKPVMPQTEPTVLTKETPTVSISPAQVVEEHDVKEFDFLNAFKQLTINENLIYKEQDLFNLHTCIKSNTLTIIAGMSGTGKTQLALTYAKMLDLDEANNTLLFLPISPSFTEPEDVLGYYSNTNKQYFAASTGLVDFLNHANQNVNKLHMVIFDEMNLSQIEFWFSPFISILERDPNDRYLTLYNEKDDCTNREVYPPRLKINENVIFIGTVNLDETTKDISDRMLDRTFVISLEKQKFSMFKTYLSSDKKGNNEAIEEHKCRSTQTYNMWRSKANQESNTLSESELKFFDDAHETISKLDSQKGISFRVLRNISSYLSNIPQKSENENAFAIISREDALDILFKQTVLSKIKGSDNQLSELLGHFDESKNFLEGDLFRVFDNHKGISHFNSSRKEIIRKVRDLSQYGYTR